MSAWQELAVVALVTALASALLARLAPRLSWTDAALGERKLQRRPVPAIGGVALLTGLAFAPASPWEPGLLATFQASWPPPWALSLALTAVFAVGTLDDRVPGGLAPRRKALLQLAALAPLGAGAWQGSAGSAWGAALLVLGGWLALNALNTFDNADGALPLLAAAGFLVAEVSIAAACLGFLPFNLDSARAKNRESGAPSAYLGDAGAFVLGFLVLATPRAWGILWLPLLDLARLALVRLRAGSRPWIGDRRHLAHRLARRGLPPSAVAFVLAAVGAPAAVLVARAEPGHALAPSALGLSSSAFLFALALFWSRDKQEPLRRPAGAPCPGGRPSQ